MLVLKWRSIDNFKPNVQFGRLMGYQSLRSISELEMDQCGTFPFIRLRITVYIYNDATLQNECL